MNYKPGMIVRSKAGHDKDHVYVIIRVERIIYICLMVI